MLLGLSHLAKTERIDRIVPLDDFDVERAATLREHLRVPGMGDTTARYFRDKLAMRSKARNAGLAVPDFIHILNYDNLREFMDRVPAPWVLKPRTMAGSIGIKKMHNAEELWRSLDTLGDQQSFYLLETLRARRHLSRRLDREGQEGAVGHRQQVWPAADGCLA